MQRNIVDLFEDALSSEDYRFKISFLVGGLVSYESNDTAEKQAQSTKYSKRFSITSRLSMRMIPKKANLSIISKGQLSAI